MDYGWTISPLLLATAETDRCQGLLYKGAGVKMTTVVLAFLVRNGKENILVDSGASGFEKSSLCMRYFEQTAEQTLEAQLARFGVDPDQITKVINTHLHLDHCAGNELCRKARCFVQAREMEYWRSPLRVHRQAYRVDLDQSAFELLEGDADIAPGVRVLLTPGHSPGSQAVQVETAAGVYVLAGDNVPLFENMQVRADEPFWPNGIYVDLREYYGSLDRLKAIGGVILPGHDPAVLKKERYPE